MACGNGWRFGRGWARRVAGGLAVALVKDYEVGVMERNDYSGPFDGDLRFEDFSVDALAGLLKVYGKLMVNLDGFWYLAIKERLGNDDAMACDHWVWDRAMKYMVDDVIELLGVEGRSVADFMRTMQVRPMCFVLGERMRVIDDNDVVLTVVDCPTLVALEKEGEGRDASHCDEGCSVMRAKHARMFNPAIEVTCLKLPPRPTPADICCEWRYFLPPA